MVFKLEEPVAKKARDTRIKRGRVSDAARHAIWVKSAGRCNVCNTFMLNSGRTYFHSVTVAEMAHMIGATATKGSPRGEDEVLDDAEAEENLLLLCHECHRLVDDETHLEFFPATKLRALKADHENRIRKATETGGMKRTAVVRIGSNIRGSFSMASRKEVAATLFADNFLGMVESRWDGDFTTRLQGDETDQGFWSSACAALDKSLTTVKQAIDAGDVEHVSVFAFAPIPLLVHLGASLDDKIDKRIYQKHRDAALGWGWHEGQAIVDFTHENATPELEGDEVVLLVAVSAPVEPSRLPEAIRGLPRFVLRPAGVSPSPTLVTSEFALNAFAVAWRDLLGQVEAAYPLAKRWHLVAAAPVSVSIEAGRAFMREAQPPVTAYQRTGETYEAVLEVNK